VAVSSKTEMPGTEMFSEAAVCDASGCSPRQLRTWIIALEHHGHRVVDGQLPLDHALAVGAALRFSEANVSRARVNAIFREMLRGVPSGDDWLVIDLRKRAPIEFGYPPVEIDLRASDRKAPVVFEPAAFLARLRDCHTP